MKEFTLTGHQLTINFIRHHNIFSDVNLSVSNKQIVGIAGANGSGKTTLLKVLACVLNPSSGNIQLDIEGNPVKKDDIPSHIGFVSPYLTLYEEFTPVEHLRLFAKFRDMELNESWAADILKEFNLFKRRRDLIKTFSSGMKQRVKYMLALQLKPELLFLDEPFTNLDGAGIDSVIGIIKSHTDNGGGVIIASNDDREKELCSSIIELHN